MRISLSLKVDGVDGAKLAFKIGHSMLLVGQLLLQIDTICEEEVKHLCEVLLKVALKHECLFDLDHSLPDLARIAFVSFKVCCLMMPLV